MLESGQSPFDPPRSHTATQEWHSFEVRMRRRRAERCVVRAEVALEAGFPDDARAALEEARRLDSSAPDFEELERRVSSRAEAAVAHPLDLIGEERDEAAGAAVLAADLAPDAPVGAAEDLPLVAQPQSDVAGEPRRGRRVLRAVAASAAVIALIAAASFGWRVVRQPAATERRADTTALAANPLVVASSPSTNAPPDRVGIIAHDVVATVRQEPVNREDPRPTGEPVAAAATEPTPDVQRAVAPVNMPVDAVPAPPVPAPFTPLAAAPSLPPAPPAPARAEVPPPPVVTATTGTSEPRPVDESVRVREVLQRYEAAYSRLDAAAAHAIWPGVDESALARAFNGLQAQQLSLGRCDVSVTGGSAQATCLGSASWTPKVGNGRTASRRWQFDLQNAAGGWRIVKAEMR